MYCITAPGMEQLEQQEVFPTTPPPPKPQHLLLPHLPPLPSPHQPPTCTRITPTTHSRVSPRAPDNAAPAQCHSTENPLPLPSPPHMCSGLPQPSPQVNLCVTYFSLNFSVVFIFYFMKSMNNYSNFLSKKII